jgi:DNA-binding NarL/FixJ family response regulator
MRILIVDDSAAVRQRLATLLRDVDGVELVAEAEDSRRALTIWRTMSPDLVVLDLDLRGESGLDILTTLKEARESPRVVVLTNHSEDAYERRCRELGADHFFDKSSQFHLAIDVVRGDVAERRQRS